MSGYGVTHRPLFGEYRLSKETLNSLKRALYSLKRGLRGYGVTQHTSTHSPLPNRDTCI